MNFNELLKNITVDEREKLPLLPIYTNHKEFQPGSIFVAVKGNVFDSHTAIASLIRPYGLILEDKAFLPKDYTGPYLVVSSTRQAVDILYHALNQFPSQKLVCVGITGTNGKTTTSHMIEYLLNQNGLPTGVIGTIDHHFKDKVWKTSLTTPGSQEFYERLFNFVGLGAKALSVEVSSHALDQFRMSSTQFDIGVFTNLTRDHLDYHGSFENYFAAKEKLFSEILERSTKKNKFAVINADDSYGSQLRIGPSIEKITYGLNSGDLRGTLLGESFAGQILEVRYLTQSWKVALPLVGNFNALNFLATFAVALALKLNLQKVCEQFQSFQGVRGRMQRVPNSQEKYVFVDYAHTPDALENVLKTLAQLRNQLRNSDKSQKIITVFGCGGDRDKGKRPLMGAIASEWSDEVILTSDNPRTEFPLQIIEEIQAGCKKQVTDCKKQVSVEVDRKKAIHKALTSAQKGDAILIAGKGHEDYQIIGKTTHPFSDVQVVEEYFKNF